MSQTYRDQAQPALRLIIRTTAPETRRCVRREIEAIAASRALACRAEYELGEESPGAVFVADHKQNERCARTAAETFGPDIGEANGPTFMGSEDFVFFA